MPGQEGAQAGDIAAQVAALAAEVADLRAQVQRSRDVLDSTTGFAVMTLDLEGRVMGWNTGASRILHYTEAEISGRVAEIFFTAEDRARGAFYNELQQALLAGRARNERWHLRRDGTRFWASGLTMPLVGTDGAASGFVTIFQDNSQLRAEHERRDLLMAELNHRIKNSFALAQAVASQTRRHAANVVDFTAALGARLAVLARSHDVLFEGEPTDAPLGPLVAAAMDGYVDDFSRVETAGPLVMIPAALVVTVCLTLHELATNAVKHGALSEPGGGVRIRWSVDTDPDGKTVLDVVWQEAGGPPVCLPLRRGFGSSMLENAMPRGGSLQLEFLPEGVRCAFRLPLGEAAVPG